MSRRIILLAALVFGVFSFAAHAYAQDVVTSSEVNGTWREVSSNSAGVTTEFWIWALGKQKLKVEFAGNNAAKGFSNTALGTILIDGTIATFQPTDNQIDEKNPCVITLKFSHDKLIVTEKGECGWGAGVGTAGTYKKVSSKMPKFDEK